MKKVLQGICYGILALVVLGTVFILVCAFKPGLTEKLADKFYNRDKETVSEEADDIAPDSDDYPMEDIPDPFAEPIDMTDSDTEEIGEDTLLSSEGYVAPDEGTLSIPKELADRTGGLVLIGADDLEISDVEAEKISDELGYGETGDGLEFDPLLYPYYNMLGNTQQHLYRQIYANAKALNQKFKPIEEINGNAVKNIFMAVYNDHPELFWLDTSYACKCKGNGTAIELDLDFNETVSDFTASKQKFEAEANKIINGAAQEGSNYDKEKYIHNAIIDKATYALDAPMSQSAYSALVNGPTVCAGYSRAMQYCMMQLGIPCYYCTGYAGQNHAWNIVKLDDGYYNVDVTWDDTDNGNYDYFNKTDDDYRSTHARRDLSVNLPACNGQAYRNLEGEDASASNIITEGMRNLDDLGRSRADVIDNLQNYYADCYHQITENGIGEYMFENLIDGENLLNEIYSKYSSREYMQGYMNAAVDQVGAATYEMDLLVEELEGKVFRLTHRIKLVQ